MYLSMMLNISVDNFFEVAVEIFFSCNLMMKISKIPISIKIQLGYHKGPIVFCVFYRQVG